MTLQSRLKTDAEIRRIEQLVEGGDYSRARSGLQNILGTHKSHAAAQWLMIRCDWLDEQRDRAISRLRKYVKDHPASVQAHCRLGEYLARQGRFNQAVSHLRTARRKHPDHPKVLCQLAMVHDMSGDLDAAINTLQPLADAGAADPDVLVEYAGFQLKAGRFERAIELLGNRIEGLDDQPADIRRRAWTTYGGACERCDRVDDAFRAYQRANAIEPPRFDTATAERFARRLMDVFTPANLDGMAKSDLETETPVIIASLPRSGGTLLERIIGAHPGACAGGELAAMTNIVRQLSLRVGSTLDFPECVVDMDGADMRDVADEYLQSLTRLDRRAKRITDKSVTNHHQTGIFSRLFPRARVIDLRRAPLDNCLACYAMDLGTGHRFSFDLTHIAGEYRRYIGLMEHWHTVLDTRILRVNYEDLVTDQEAESRRIIDFLGLEWNDACLRFHVRAGRLRGMGNAPAPTLSAHQVSRPIYRTSIRRAEKFASHLDSVRAVLDIPEGDYPLGHDLRY